MFGIGKKLKTKKAGITIEIALSLALMLVVLFLVLGLFSNNLQGIAKNSGIMQIFNKSKSSDKLYGSNTFSISDRQGTDPTQTQVNVQVVADQGLDYYLTQAQNTIDQYKDATSLTPQQTEDLARAITAVCYNNLSDPNSDGSLSYPDLRAKYNIKVTLSGINNQTQIKLNSNTTETLSYKNTGNKLADIKVIYTTSYN